MADGEKKKTPIPTISERTGGVRTRGGRLPQIRTREIPQPSTSGTARRIIAPNIVQRRVKKEEKPQNEGKQIAAPSSKPIRDPSQRGRGRGRREYVQTGGSLFGEGVTTDPTLKKESRSTDSSSEFVYKPAYKPIKNKTKQELEAEEQQCLKDDDDYSGSEDENDVPPIVLIHKSTAKKEIKIEKKPKIEIKGEDEMETTVKIKKDFDVPVKEENFDDKKDLREILQNSKETDAPKLFLLQFPEKLFTEKESVPDTVPSTSTAGPSNSQPNKNKDMETNPMDNLIEGFVGKLQILKSGKMRLVCGDVIMNVEDNNLSNFYEELVTIQTNSDSNPTVLQLGPIEKHLTVLPAVELLKTS